MSADPCGICRVSVDRPPPAGRRRRGLAVVNTSAPWENSASGYHHLGCLERAVALARRQIREEKAAAKGVDTVSDIR